MQYSGNRDEGCYVQSLALETGFWILRSTVSRWRMFTLHTSPAVSSWNVLHVYQFSFAFLCVMGQSLQSGDP